MKADKSFSQKLRAGWTKEQLMAHYALSEAQYERVLVCLKTIGNEPPDRAAKEPPKESSTPKEDSTPKEPEVSIEKPKEASKEALKMESKSDGIQDSALFVLDILRTHRQEPGISKDTIQNVLRAMGYAMLDIDSILEKLKTAGEIIEPRKGVFRVV